MLIPTISFCDQFLLEVLHLPLLGGPGTLDGLLLRLPGVGQSELSSQDIHQSQLT